LHNYYMFYRINFET